MVQRLSSRAAEYGHHLVIRKFQLHGIEDFLKAQPIVSIIYNRFHVPVSAGVFLHASVHRDLFQALLHFFCANPRRIGSRNGSQCIFHVENPMHRQCELLLEPVTAHSKSNFSIFHCDIMSIDISLRRFSKGQHPFCAGGRSQYPAAVLGIQVHDCRPHLTEQLQLGLKIIFKIPVFRRAYMIFRYVQENPHIKLDSLNPFIF